MPKQEVPAPLLGVTDATPFIKQPGDSTDPDGLRNMVRTNSASGREQLATRAKLAVETDIARNTGRVNALDSIARASGVAGIQTTDTQQGTTGTTRVSGAIRGQLAILETDRSLRAILDDTRGTGISIPPTGSGGHSGEQVCFHQTDADIGYFATFGQDTAITTQAVETVGLNRFSLASDSITHQGRVVDADAGYSSPLPNNPPGPVQSSLFSNQVVHWGPYLFVAVSHYVYVFHADTLVYLYRHPISWSLEVQSMSPIRVGTTDYLMVLITGSRDISGPVVTDANEYFGEFYRTGVLMYKIKYTNYTTRTALGVGVDPIERQRMPMGLQTGGAGFEDHRYFRPSEFSLARPRGGIAYGMQCVVGTDNSVYAYIARTNQGFGYDGSLTGQKPDGSGAFISACRANLTKAFISAPPAYVAPTAQIGYGLAESAGGWERDTDSLRRPYTWGALTYQNDIPALDSGGRPAERAANEPSLLCVAVDAARGLVYFAGRRASLTLAASNIYCLEAETGVLLWDVDVVGTVLQNGIAVDPVSGNLIVGMLRNKGWTTPDGTASGDKAEVLELDSRTGQVVNSFDLTDVIVLNGRVTSANEIGLRVGAHGIAVNARGQIAVALSPHRYDT